MLLYGSKGLVVTVGGAQGTGGVPSLGVPTDHGADDKTWGILRVGLPPGSGGYGSLVDSPHMGVN